MQAINQINYFHICVGITDIDIIPDETLFIDYVYESLLLNPHDRPTASQALAHAWLRNAYDTDFTRVKSIYAAPIATDKEELGDNKLSKPYSYDQDDDCAGDDDDGDSDYDDHDNDADYEDIDDNEEIEHDQDADDYDIEDEHYVCEDDPFNDSLNGNIYHDAMYNVNRDEDEYELQGRLNEGVNVGTALKLSGINIEDVLKLNSNILHANDFPYVDDDADDDIQDANIDNIYISKNPDLDDAENVLNSPSVTVELNQVE